MTKETNEYAGEYRSPGYWLTREERIQIGMDPDTGEWLPKEKPIELHTWECEGGPCAD